MLNFRHPRYWPMWIGLALLRAAILLPLPLLWAIGSVLGLLMYALHAPRRHIVAVNLAKVFPELTPAARAALARRHFRALGQALFDAALMWWAPLRRLRRLVHFHGREHYDRALAAGRPVILLAPHFVAMEVGGMMLSAERPVATMFREPKNRLFNVVLRRARVRFGGQIIERHDGLRPVVHAVKKGRVFYYLPDQDLGHDGTLFAPFFGVPTATLAVLGRLARLTGAAVIPCFARQRAYGRGYEIAFDPPLAAFPSGDDFADAVRMNQVIETAVRVTPAQYFWVHKRFKTRPAGEPDFYARGAPGNAS